MGTVSEGTVKQWGGSLAIHLSAREAARLQLRPGMKITWELVKDDDTIDLGDPPFFTGGPRDGSVRHDELLYGEE